MANFKKCIPNLAITSLRTYTPAMENRMKILKQKHELESKLLRGGDIRGSIAEYYVGGYWEFRL